MDVRQIVRKAGQSKVWGYLHATLGGYAGTVLVAGALLAPGWAQVAFAGLWVLSVQANKYFALKDQEQQIAALGEKLEEQKRKAMRDAQARHVPIMGARRG